MVIQKVQMFETTKTWDLQRLVNDFLKAKAFINIIDIKYNQSPIRLGRDEFEESVTEYTAMIIYTFMEEGGGGEDETL